MNFNDVYNRFKLISSLTDKEISDWVPIITESMEYVCSIVSKNDLTDYDYRRLNNAAAVYAYRCYILYTINKENSFTAGDISVTINKDVVSDTENMWKRELDSISDLVASTFTFKRVM